MIVKSAIILLAIAHSGQSIFFDLLGGGLGGGGGSGCCGGGYGSNYGGGSYGGYDYGASNYGYQGGQQYAPTQTFVQQPARVSNGYYIVRSKVYKPFIKRTTVQLIPQQGEVVKPYSTQYVPGQTVSQPSYSSGANYAPSYGSYGGQGYSGNYGQGYSGGYSNYGQGGYGGYGSQGYGSQGYGGYGSSSYGGGIGGLGSMFG